LHGTRDAGILVNVGDAPNRVVTEIVVSFPSGFEIRLALVLLRRYCKSPGNAVFHGNFDPDPRISAKPRKALMVPWLAAFALSRTTKITGFGFWNASGRAFSVDRFRLVFP
jgi:hypothetical protein